MGANCQDYGYQLVLWIGGDVEALPDREVGQVVGAAVGQLSPGLGGFSLLCAGYRQSRKTGAEEEEAGGSGQEPTGNARRRKWRRDARSEEKKKKDKKKDAKRKRVSRRRMTDIERAKYNANNAYRMKLRRSNIG